MNAEAELERIVSEWLDADATPVGADRVLSSTLARVAVTRQERYVAQRLFGVGRGTSPQLRWALLLAATIVSLLAVGAIVGGLQARPEPVGTGGFIGGPSLSVARGMHTATSLNDGRVLIIGGLGGGVIPIDSVEIWDGTSSSFSRIAPLPLPRGNHTATLLRDGRVLIVGDDGTGPDFADPASAELWDPATGSFTPTGSMAVARRDHTATLLPDGRVFVVGGVDPTSPDGRPIAEAEVWDPGTGAFTAGGTLAAGRTEHSATLLPDGRILVVGGGECSRTAETWDPATAAFRPTGSMAASRATHTATLLPDGRVLVLGGWGDDAPEETAELWDPASGTFTATGFMQATRFGHTATLLGNGSVLVVGGAGEEDGVRARVAEVWDPATSSFRTAGTLASSRRYHTATLLADDRVLIVGHGSRNNPLATSEIWDANGLDGPRVSPSPTPPGPSPTEAPQPATSGEQPAATASTRCP